MNRRDLNRILMIGTALAGGWPAWLRRAFGAESGRTCPLPTGQEGELRWRRIVAAAYRRGQQAGKPLLAFVIPEVADDAGDRYLELWNRGRAFGELLNHGDDEAMATLALAEIVCAPMSALRTLAPSLRASEPLMVLIETSGIPARVRALDVALTPDPDWRRDHDTPPSSPADWDTFFEQQRKKEDSIVQGRIAALSRLLHEGLRGTPGMLMERAAQAQARLDERPAALSPDDAGPAQLHRVSAILLAAAVSLPERLREPAIARIADAARFVLCRRRVPGSRWSNYSGCGSYVEREAGENDGDEGFGISCGMGHVPEKSQRFLDFLSRDATWRFPS